MGDFSKEYSPKLVWFSQENYKNPPHADVLKSHHYTKMFKKIITLY
jgi:hypothetical protein